MSDINDILANLNSRYEEIINLVPDMRVFVDDFAYAKNEYEVKRDNAPLGSQLYILDDLKVLWVGIDGAENDQAKNVRRYNPDGTLDTTFTCPNFISGTNGFVRSVGVQSNGKLIVVGHFNTVGGDSYGKIVRLNTDGSVDTTFNNGGSGFDNHALVVRVLPDDSILVGGTFNNYNGTSVDRLVKLSHNGTSDTSFTDNLTAVNGQVHEIFVDGTSIYVGGSFTNNIVKLNSDGSTDGSFMSSFNNRVTAIKKDSNGKIVVGGWFDQLNSSNCNPGIVRLNSDGTVDSTFATEGDGLNNPEGIVQTVHVQADNKIIVGGWFNELNNERCGGIVRFNTNGTKDTSFDVGYGMGKDTNDWEGPRIQNIVSFEDITFACVGSFDAFDSRAVNSFVVLNSSGGIAGNLNLFNYTTTGISDGGDDMYDSGNFLNTNLTQAWDDISGDNVDRSLSIPNTHTAASNEDCFHQNEDGENGVPFYSPWMDGRVVDGENYFGEGSSYFTNMYPGLFVMVATGININEFSVAGDVGSDSNTQNESSIIVTHEGATYTVFLKVNREGDGTETDGDPSVNQLIIVPGDSSDLTQLINEDSDDYDDHCVQGLSGRSSIAYLVVARNVSDYISNEDAEAIALKFLEVTGGFSSVQTYSATSDSSYDLSPQVVKQVGEGSLDTAIVEVDGERVSLQRTGYYELVDSEGNRKIVAVKDGETWDDAPETPEATDNPNGHPNFGANDVYSIMEQVIPVGNPLAR